MFKKTLLLFMLFSGINTAIAQTQNVTCRKDSIIQLDEQGNQKYKKVFLYDQAGKLIEETENDYINNTKNSNLYIYNSQDQLITKKILNNDIFRKRFLYEYSQEGNLEKEFEQDTVVGEWKNKIRVEYAYDQIDSLIEKNKYQFINDIWYLIYKEIFSYDNEGRIILDERSTWSYPTTHNILTTNRYNYTYSVENGKKIRNYNYSFWFRNENRFQIVDSVIQEYDFNNLLLMETKYTNSLNTNTNYDNRMRTINTYDVDGNLLEKELFIYNMSNNVWINNEKNTYRYNTQNKNIYNWTCLTFPESQLSYSTNVI